jgi:hypothetical protein
VTTRKPNGTASAFRFQTCQSIFVTELVTLSQADAMRLSARSLVTFGSIFFKKTFRQTSPQFHHDLSELLLTPGNRLVGAKIFRGGAKTSLCRVNLAFRAAWAIGNTGMIVGENSTHAQRSIRWLKKQVKFNSLFSQTFGLREGSKWADDWIEIVNEKIGPQHGAPTTYTLVALGVTGATRGLNIDDYRPDFILCDDICGNENTATVEARKKTEEVFFGDLLKSLAPETESPIAQLAMLQTPINEYDIISKAEKDPSFRVLNVSCFGPDGQSAWPKRWSTDTLLADKAAHIKRKQFHLWMREMEVKIVKSEETSFDINWAQDYTVYPDNTQFIISVDPAPFDIEQVEATEKQDWLVVSAVGFSPVIGAPREEDTWIDKQHSAKNEKPDVTVNKIFEMCRLYNTREVVIESVAYQKVLAWLVEREMEVRRQYLTIHQFTDKRAKYDRITQAYIAIGPYGRLHVRSSCDQFLTEFGGYGVGYKGHDDHLDSPSIAIAWRKRRLLSDKDLEGEFTRLREEDEPEDVAEEQGNYLSCP